MSSFKTKGGSELPILNLRGKDYLEVKYRVVWFREEHPDWTLETELVSVTKDSCLAKAWVKNAEGKIMAMAHKFEDVAGFRDFIEKSETSAIGRALALCGYGTQFCADELDEGERLADSPGPRPTWTGPKPSPVTPPPTPDYDAFVNMVDSLPQAGPPPGFMDDEEPIPQKTKAQEIVERVAAKQQMAKEKAPVHCDKPMYLSKFPNKATGAFDWVCLTCKARVPRPSA